MFMTDRSALMTPQNATLDSKRILSRFVSYRRLSSQFQFSLSAVTLVYLSQWFVLLFYGVQMTHWTPERRQGYPRVLPLTPFIFE
jgi:hypothetical protein